MDNIRKVLNMRGIVVKKFGGIEELVIENNLDIPSVQSDQLLIKMKSSGINPVDTYIRSGIYPKLPSLPYTPGKEGAGIVEQVGQDVQQFKVGDRVFCCENTSYGTLAQYSCMKETNVFTLGSKLTFDEGAAISIAYFTAYRALILKAKARKGNKVLIHGASGAVGLAAVQIAKAYGMMVVGTAGTKEGIDVVHTSGADAVFNHRESDYLKHLQNQDKFDVIIEMLSNVNLQNDLMLMAPQGITVIIGCRGEIKINPRLLMTSESSIIGCQLFQSTEDEWKEISEAIVKGIEDGWVKPTINKIYPLKEVGAAHNDIINTGSKGASGKLVVKVED